MIKEQNELLAQIKRSLSDEQRYNLRDGLRCKRKMLWNYDYEAERSKTKEQLLADRELDKDLEWLEDNI